MQIVDVVAGLILGPPDLFQNHAFLTLQLFRLDERVEHRVGENVDPILYFAAEDAAVIARHLLVRNRVWRAATAFYLLRDLAGGAGLGPFEEHVLDQMGDPRLVIFLMAAAR